MIRLFITIIFVLCGASKAYALDWKSDITLSPQPMNYSGPADSVKPGNIIGSTWSATASVQQVFWCGYIIYNCNKSTMMPGSGAISTGMSVNVDGVNYAVFETGVTGVGFIIGLKDFNSSAYIPLQDGVTQTYPAPGTSGTSPDLGWSAKVTFIKTGHTLSSGVYLTSSIDAAVLTAYNNEVKTARVIINPVSITVQASGCTVNTKAANVDLGVIDVRTLPSVGSTSAFGHFDIALSCDENIAVNAVMTDQAKPANTSSVVSLTSNSTAAGVGVEFFYDGNGPLMLGPDSSASGTLNQFFVQSTGQAQTLTLPFQARYIRTGDLQPGTANALASITFSYQ
ncbi:fimbrial protein [Yersinia thracica]|uniref:fimbrial protein n=1 Tax=Yersinia thracica TaxID=2890319 RepID=UPI0011A2E757|nr:fimbrial protein [Yersinia thracica]